MKRNFVVGPGGILWWFPVVALSVLIFTLSSDESPVGKSSGFLDMDKVLHFGAYGVWAVLLALPVAGSWPEMPTRSFVLVVGMAGSLYGLTDEFHQRFVPSRDADVLDLAADALGAFAGAIVAAVVRNRVRKSLSRPRV